MANRFLRGALPLPVVEKLVTKAVFEGKLIEEGDRVLIAASGGKDSAVMAWVLSRLKRIIKVNYELEAVHIAADFGGPAALFPEKLRAKLFEWDIPLTTLDIPVIGRLKEGKKMNCYWCSTLRRKELLAYAMENRFNKIALGHHLDDIIETFFMNLLGKGETSPMPPKLVYEKYPVSLIRPLARVEEKYVIAAAKELDIMGEVSTCPFGANSSRLVIRRKIAALTDNSSAIKQRVFSALLELVKTGGGGARAGGD